MSQPEEIEAFDREFAARDVLAQVVAEHHPRAVGSPLSMGTSSRQSVPQPFEGNGANGSNGTHGINGSNGSNGHNGSNGSHGSRATSSLTQGRAVASKVSSGEEPTGFQRAVNLVRSALPLVQRILPLLDGNIGTAVSNFLTPPQRPQSQEPPPTPKVDLAPLQENLAELRTQQRQLRDQLVEQNGSLKRVEDQLEMVREATDRNTLEQQELLEDLKSFSHKVKIGSFIGIGLLTLGVVLNVVLYLHIKNVLP